MYIKLIQLLSIKQILIQTVSLNKINRLKFNKHNQYSHQHKILTLEKISENHTNMYSDKLRLFKLKICLSKFLKVKLIYFLIRLNHLWMKLLSLWILLSRLTVFQAKLLPGWSSKDQMKFSLILIKLKNKLSDSILVVS